MGFSYDPNQLYLHKNIHVPAYSNYILNLKHNINLLTKQIFLFFYFKVYYLSIQFRLNSIAKKRRLIMRKINKYN